jgi:hypothetical protein
LFRNIEQYYMGGNFDNSCSIDGMAANCSAAQDLLNMGGGGAAALNCGGSCSDAFISGALRIGNGGEVVNPEGNAYYLDGDRGRASAFDLGLSSTSDANSLRLVPKSDYCAGGDRHIFYRVQTLNSNNTLGAIPNPAWYVSEHQTVKALAGPHGTSLDATGNQFDDWISGAGSKPVNSIQTFTVAQSLSPNAASYSIMVRIGNQDYGSLGIYTSNPPIVQGVQCPASLAHR